MKVSLTAAALALLFAGIQGAAAADVSGTWKIDGSVFGFAVKPTCIFKQDGTKLTGTCSGSPNDGPLTGENPDGKTINWQYAADDKGDKHDMKFTGVLDSDKTMKGKFTADGHGGKFTAQKQ